MTEKLTKIVVDCSTGKQTILPLTAAEIAQRDQDAAKFAEEQAKQKAEEKRISDLKDSARAKLASGDPLTEEEAAVIVI